MFSAANMQAALANFNKKKSEERTVPCQTLKLIMTIPTATMIRATK
jgi:hypothetical protein